MLEKALNTIIQELDCENEEYRQKVSETAYGSSKEENKEN